MLITPNPNTGIGGNLPPEPIDPFDAIKRRVEDLVKAANEWLASVPEITDETTATACDSFLSQVKAEIKALDEDRKAINEPHRKAIAENDERFRPITAMLKKVQDLLSPKKTAWLKREQERIAEERRKAEEEALRKLQEAEAAAAKEPTTVEEAVAAEEKIKAAESAIKMADRLAKAKAQVKGDLSARASGLRTYWHARITDYQAALKHYGEHPKVREVVQSLADADARTQKDALNVPGVEAYSDQKAA